MGRIEEKTKDLEQIKETFRGFFEDENIQGETDEKNFITQYLGLETVYKEENIEPQKAYLDVSARIKRRDRNTTNREILETERYNALMDMYSSMEELDWKEIAKFNDRFHTQIKSCEEYTMDFDKEPLLIMKIRNLQMLNKVAHKIDYLIKRMLLDIIEIENNSVSNYSDKEWGEISFRMIEMYTSLIDEDRKDAKIYLEEKIGKNPVQNLENNKYIKKATFASRWLFREKTQYLEEILADLQKMHGEYNYGTNRGAFVIDVPGYGQVNVHAGASEEYDRIRKQYNVPIYNGRFLGDLYILSKANPELFEGVNYDELSRLDKQRYKIESQSNQKQNYRPYEELINSEQYKEKAGQIIKILNEIGIEPKKIINEEVLKNSDIQAVKDVIRIFEQGYGIDANILYKCKLLLQINQEKAIDIMLMLEKMNQLGVSTVMIEKNPEILIFSNTEKFDEAYNVLNEYSIQPTNGNLSIALRWDIKEIKRNLDLLIENEPETYEILRENLTYMFKEGVEKKLDSLDTNKGQELISDSKYYIENISENMELDNEQKALVEKLCQRFNKSKAIGCGAIMKINDRYYSFPRVKEQLERIFYYYDIHDLKKENVEEILKIALLKDKNIDKEEVEQISEILKYQKQIRERIERKKRNKQNSDDGQDSPPQGQGGDNR